MHVSYTKSEKRENRKGLGNTWLHSTFPGVPSVCQTLGYRA